MTIQPLVKSVLIGFGIGCLPLLPGPILGDSPMLPTVQTLTNFLLIPGTSGTWPMACTPMLGDSAPWAELKQLLDRHDNLRLYIDDAHSTSCFGTHGRGLALEHFGDDERVVVALSLNKAFSAAGGVVALPTREAAERIRRCGGPMLFSGPIQPPMLGAAVGSARLHTSIEFPYLQAELRERIEQCVALVGERDLQRAGVHKTPIFQTQCDSPRVAFSVARLMQERGFLCCICVFPAVPINRPGIRFTILRNVSRWGDARRCRLGTCVRV